MAPHRPLSQAEKERIYQGKLAGQRLSELAAELGCSIWCVRKWWRRGQAEGLNGLGQARRGRGQSGVLGQFEPIVSQKALVYKGSHQRWGARRVLVALAQAFKAAEPAVRLPSASRLALFFKERCPEWVNSPKPAPPPPPRPPRAKAVHQIWQLDSQEGIKLADADVVTMANLRDERGCAQLAARVFSVKTARRWRKLRLAEVQQVLREAFSEWHTLPDALLTDNELGLAGVPTDPYPSRLTLWLVGLGVTHLLIRPGCPQDQAQVERSHLTMDNFTLCDAALTNCATLQHHLDAERYQYNYFFPSRAGDCAGRPPLVAHPDLLTPRHPYHPSAEVSLFSLQRVADYLATLTFARKVNDAGQISLGRQRYSVGRAYAHQTVQARFDPEDWLWVITPWPQDQAQTASPKASPILARRVPKDFSVEAITGLEPTQSPPSPPSQLRLPGFSV